nr:MAG: hypothetical protein TU35_02015 [Thermoproteus sp. AZ2]
MDYVGGLRRVELALYAIALAVTIILAGYSLYLIGSDITRVYNPDPVIMSQNIYSLLSDLFLFIIFVELIDTFITYIQHKEIVVYKIIDVALVALARELFIYVSPTIAESFSTTKAAALIAALLVVGVIDYLQRKAH